MGGEEDSRWYGGDEEWRREGAASVRLGSSLCGLQ